MGETRSATDAFAVRLAEWAMRWRWFVMIAAVLATVGISSGGQFLTFATNYRVFFSDQNPELAAYEKFQATYSQNDNILVVLIPEDGTVFTEETLSVVHEFTEVAWGTEFVLRVDSLANFQHTYAEGDDLIVENLVEDPADLTPEALARIEDIALNEPLLRNLLVSPDGAATAINIVLQYPGEAVDEVPRSVTFVRENIRDVIEERYPNIEVRLTGMSMLNNSFVESGMADLQTLMPAMFLVVVILMLVTLRTVSGVFATCLIVVLSIPIAFGAAGFAGIELTPISNAAMIVILTLAIADSVHILLSARTAMRRGLDKKAAIVDAVRVNFLAVTITSLTTIVGFLALNASDAPPYRHFGNMSAVGIFAAWALSLTLLPALMSVLPMKVKARGGAAPTEAPRMRALADFVIAHNRKLLVSVGAVSLALVALIPQIQFNDQWVEYFDKRLEVRQDNERALEYFGLYAVEFSLLADGPGGVSNPEFLAKVEEFADFIRTQEGVTHVYALSDIMKRLNKNLHADDPAMYRIPDNRDLSAQYLLLYELSLPYGLDLNDRINIDKSATRVTANLTNVTTQQTVAFLEAAEVWLADNGLESMQTPQANRTQATGPQVMFTFVAERNVQSMISGNIVAVVVIALIMIFALRSLPLGLLSLIPNGLPILVTFGAWAVLVGTVGFSVASVAAVSLGIVVDDTVHFLTKYRRARVERGDSVENAIRYAFETVGFALVVNTVVLAIGFSVLAFSTFKLNGDMGLLTALAITFALILDFLLLPPLLLLLQGGPSTSAAAPTDTSKGADHGQPVPAQ